MEVELRNSHLTEEELLRIALPAAGEPAALPSHLLQCAVCGRALQEWKGALREIAEEDEVALARRPAEEWLAAEEATLAAIRRAGAPGRRRPALRWAVSLAASLLLAVFLLTGRQPTESGGVAVPETAELSAQDLLDDALLRDVALLSRGEDAGGLWNSMAPMPLTNSDSEKEEESL